MKSIVNIMANTMREYILGLSIYLNARFIVLVNNQDTLINLVFWIGFMFFMFEKFVLVDVKQKDLFGKYTKHINYTIRIIFIFLSAYTFKK